MELRDLSRDDLQQYFHGSIFSIPGSDSVIKVREVSKCADTKEIAFQGPVSVKGGPWGERMWFEHKDVCYEIPDPGLIQVGKAAYLFARIPARQWNRGLRTSIIDIRLVDEYFLRNYNRNIVGSLVGRDSPMLFYSMFHPSMAASLEEAIESIVDKKKHITRVLTPDFAVGLSNTVDELVVYYKSFPIGECSVGGKISIAKEFARLENKFNEDVKQKKDGEKLNGKISRY